MDKEENKYSTLSLTFDGAVATLRFIRGKQHNSMNSAFWKELPLAIDELEANTQARVCILSAEGPSFSSGMDLSVFMDQSKIANDTAQQRERLQRLIAQMQSVFTRLEKCRVPVIAAVQGACIGAGFDLICACDLRYATEKAYFSIHEINLAMMADLGTLQRLPRLISEAAVRELALTGDKLKAKRAYELGLVGELFEDEEKLSAHVSALAKKIAERSPLAIHATRQALRYARSHSVEDGLEMAAVLQSAIFSGTELLQAVAAQKAGSNPQFGDLDKKAIVI